MMRIFVWGMMLLLGLSACDNTKEKGQQTVRQLSGSGMIEQEKAAKQKLDRIEQQQQERYQQLDEQMGQQDGQ